MDGEERAAPTESSSRIKTQRVFYTTPGRVVGNAEVILSPSALPRGPETLVLYRTRPARLPIKVPLTTGRVRYSCLKEAVLWGGIYANSMVFAVMRKARGIGGGADQSTGGVLRL